MNQLGDALELAGFTADEVTKLRNFSQLKELRSLVNGHAQITVAKHVIDMDAPSKRAPKEWEVREKDQLANRMRGQVEWNPTNASLFLSEKQKADYDVGHDLRKDLEKLKPQQLYTDAVVDFYLDHPEIPTPEVWLGKWIFCWGRVYRDASDDLIVRCLRCFRDGSRFSYCDYLGISFYSYSPALVAGK